jgi:hypothetical protein
MIALHVTSLLMRLKNISLQIQSARLYSQFWFAFQSTQWSKNAFLYSWRELRQDLILMGSLEGSMLWLQREILSKSLISMFGKFLRGNWL